MIDLAQLFYVVLNGPVRRSVALHLRLALQVSANAHIHVKMSDYAAEPRHMHKQLGLLYFAAQYKFGCFFCSSKQTRKAPVPLPRSDFNTKECPASARCRSRSPESTVCKARSLKGAVYSV